MKSRKKKNLRLPFYEQEEPKTCAIACLRMVMEFHGISRSEEELSALCQPDPLSGLDPEVLVAAVEKFGLRAEAGIATIEDLRTLTQQAIYPIALIVPEREDPMTTMHAVVVRKVYKRKIRLFDPLVGKVNVPMAEFDQRWEAYGRWLIIVREKEPAT